MKLRTFAGLFILLLAAGSGLPSYAADKKPAAPAAKQETYTKEEVESAFKVAQAFLVEVVKDEGRTWEFLSPLAQKQTTESQWKTAIYTLNAICGPVIIRNNLRVSCYNQLPNAPAGRYFIFQTDSKFERLNMAERTVVVKNGDGWKVAGYFRAQNIP